MAVLIVVQTLLLAKQLTISLLCKQNNYISIKIIHHIRTFCITNTIFLVVILVNIVNHIILSWYLLSFSGLSIEKQESIALIIFVSIIKCLNKIFSFYLIIFYVQCSNYYLEFIKYNRIEIQSTTLINILLFLLMVLLLKNYIF